MEKDKHYLFVGSFVLLTLLAAALFSVWLIGAHDKNLYMLYRIRFSESVSGLDVGGPVKFRGVQVGKVESMSIDPADTRLIQVDVSILKSAPIKTDTVASLKLQGITGSVYIELTGSNGQDLVSDNDKKNGTDQIPEIRSEPSTLNTLMEKLSHMTNQVDKLFSDKNVASFNDIIRNLDKASQNLSEMTHTLKDDPSKLIFSSKKKEQQD